MRLLLLAASGAVLSALVALLLQPCGDWHPDACTLLLDWSLCALYPSLSRQLCGTSCGWCKPDGSFRPWLPTRVPRWHQIERVAANISLDDFVRRYKSKHIPVIFENWVRDAAPSLERWNLAELSRVCGDRVVGVAERRAAFLQELDDLLGAGTLRRLVDAYMRAAFNTTVASSLELAQRKYTLGDFIAMMEAAPRQAASMSFASLLHYMTLPLSINDLSAWAACVDLWEDSVLPAWATVGNLQYESKQACLLDRRLKPNVFIEADGSRAYPGHQHGGDLTHGFQAMLQGAKRVVHWPYSERHKLYPVMRSMTSEFSDEVYMAEGVYHRFDLFPAMADTEAWEGTVKEGELLFVPALGVHVFESVGVSLGIRYTHQDQAVAKIGRHLLEEGSSTVSAAFVEDLESLRPYPPEMEERELPLLAERLKCYGPGS